ncbi:MAG: hypothetical protein QM756_45300 [Polyangiaceae bacterium]
MSAPEARLEQRFGFFKRYGFVLGEDGIAVSIRTLHVRRKYVVPLATVLETPCEEAISDRRLLWLSGGLWVAAGYATWMFLDGGKAEWQAPFLWAVLAIVVTFAYSLSRQTYYAFSVDAYPLMFHREKPSSAAVDAFVAAAQAAAHVQVRKQVLADAADPEDLMQRLKWLREKKIVDQAEYTVLRQQAQAERDSMPDEPSEPNLH